MSDVTPTNLADAIALIDKQWARIVEQQETIDRLKAAPVQVQSIGHMADITIKSARQLDPNTHHDVDSVRHYDTCQQVVTTPRLQGAWPPVMYPPNGPAADITAQALTFVREGDTIIIPSVRISIKAIMADAKYYSRDAGIDALREHQTIGDLNNKIVGKSSMQQLMRNLVDPALIDGSFSNDPDAVSFEKQVADMRDARQRIGQTMLDKRTLEFYDQGVRVKRLVVDPSKPAL